MAFENVSTQQAPTSLRLQCMINCMLSPACDSYNYLLTDKTCELNTQIPRLDQQTFTAVCSHSPGVQYRVITTKLWWQLPSNDNAAAKTSDTETVLDVAIDTQNYAQTTTTDAAAQTLETETASEQAMALKRLCILLCMWRNKLTV